MGERSWARLTIGGRVSRAALAEALERLEGLRLEDCLEDQHVIVEDSEASWGGFSQLEAWLQARGIPFDLESEACPGAWPDMLVHFRPGRGRVEFVSDDRHAEPMVPRSALQTALARCRTLTGLRGWLVRTYPEGARARPDHLDPSGLMHALSDTEALERIWECLNRVEWSADTLEAIAALVEATGRRIAPPPVEDRQ